MELPLFGEDERPAGRVMQPADAGAILRSRGFELRKVVAGTIGSGRVCHGWSTVRKSPNVIPELHRNWP